MKNIFIFILSVLIFVGVTVFLPEYQIQELIVTEHPEAKGDFDFVGIKDIKELEKYYKGIISFDKFNIRLKITLNTKFDELISKYDNMESTYLENEKEFKKWYGCENYLEYKKIHEAVTSFRGEAGELLHASLVFNSFKIEDNGIIFDSFLQYEKKNIDIKVKLYNKEADSEQILKFISINEVTIDER